MPYVSRYGGTDTTGARPRRRLRALRAREETPQNLAKHPVHGEGNPTFARVRVTTPNHPNCANRPRGCYRPCMDHGHNDRPSIDPPESERPSNPLVQFVQSIDAEQRATLDELAAMDRAGVSEANELDAFKQAHDGMSPGEWLRLQRKP